MRVGAIRRMPKKRWPAYAARIGIHCTGFFAHLLEKHSLIAVAPEKGRFRTFLLAALKNFLANEKDKSNALKRGGGKRHLSLDHENAESRYQIEPSHELTPERLFERQWALSLLEQVLAALWSEYAADGNGPLFEELKEALTGQTGGYADIAARLGRTEGAIKVAAHRLRQRYRELTRAKVAETVSDRDVDDEMRHLLEVLGGLWSEVARLSSGRRWQSPPQSERAAIEAVIFL